VTAAAPDAARLVLLGASTLARDFPTVLAAARETLAPAVGHGPLEVFTACGHGRSYGTWSRLVLVRGLPGIAGCGLWDALAARSEHSRTYALVTDIGNDVGYGAQPAEIAGWVETCLERLAALGARTAMTLLPLASLQRLSRWKLQLLRRLLYPTHRTTYEQIRDRTAELQQRLRDLAGRYGVPALEPDPEWFGPDRIHFRHGSRERAWRRMLALWDGAPGSAGAAVAPRPSRLSWWRMTPERWSLAGVRLGRAQPAGRLEEGTSIWLY